MQNRQGTVLTLPETRTLYILPFPAPSGSCKQTARSAKRSQYFGRLERRGQKPALTLSNLKFVIIPPVDEGNEKGLRDSVGFADKMF